ncbi:hypothetical protein Tco_0048783, partial [Tanacetum coccineum]
SGVTTRIPEKLLGDEGLCFGGTKLNSIFITAELRPGNWPRDSLIDFLLNPPEGLKLIGKLGKRQEEKGPSPGKSGPDIKRRVQTSNMRKVRMTLVKA